VTSKATSSIQVRESVEVGQARPWRSRRARRIAGGRHATMARFAPASAWSGVVMPRVTEKPLVPEEGDVDTHVAQGTWLTQVPTAAPVRLRTRPPSR
jgi:hypothetical protein